MINIEYIADANRVFLVGNTYPIKENLKQIPGWAFDPRRRLWNYPATPASIKNIVDALSRMQQPITLDVVSQQILEQHDVATGIKAATENSLEYPSSKTKAWHHQAVGYHMIAKQTATMLAYDMGTGKSKCIVDAICNLTEIQTALIVCPKSVIANWPREFSRHGRPDVAVDLCELNKGSIVKRVEMAKQKMAAAKILGHKFVAIINYEACWMSSMADFLKDVNFNMVVLDESQKCKSPSGKASRFLASIGSHATKRICLTGTPMPHSPMDVYAQYRFLDPGIYGTSFTAFRARYAVMGGFHNKQIISFQRMDELNKKFYSIAHRVMKSDVCDLPEVLHERRTIELCPKARKIYDDIEDSFIADVGEGVITASNALARLLRLQQLTSGFFVTDDGIEGEFHSEIDSGKRGELMDIIESLPNGEPLVVFCRFRHDLDSIAKAAEEMKLACRELSGRKNELAQWQTGDGQILAVQIQAGGVGIDLTRAAYCVYYSVGFSLGDYDQSLARVHRPGQTRPVTYIHIVAANTVDVKVYRALKNRADLVKSVLSLYQESDNADVSED